MSTSGERPASAALKPGDVFVLTIDVANPESDRRQKYDWRVFPVIRAGTRFHAVQDSNYGRAPDSPITRFTALQRVQAHASLYRITAGHPLWDKIVPNLERIERTLDDVLTDNRWPDAQAILKHLIETGKMTLDRVVEVMTELEEIEAEKEAARERERLSTEAAP